MFKKMACFDWAVLVWSKISVTFSPSPCPKTTMTDERDDPYESISALFSAIDVNSDGELNKTELLSAVTRRRIKEPELDTLFQQVCQKFPKLSQLIKPGSVRTALTEMDTDKDGTVSVHELVAFCQNTDDDVFYYTEEEEADLHAPKAHLDSNEMLLPEDVLAKAERLGINIDKETHLLWIARQALLTPLPPDWEFSWVAEEGRSLYHNLITSDKTVSHPANDYFKQMVSNQRTKPSPRTAGMDGAWMDFETSTGRTYYYSFKQQRRVTKCPFGVHLLSRPRDVQFSVLDMDNDGNGSNGGSSGGNNGNGGMNGGMNGSFSSSKLLDEQGSASRRRAEGRRGGGSSGGSGSGSGRGEERERRGHIRDLNVLEFKSWWTETKQGMEKGSIRRYMDLLYSCETGQFQVILDRSDKVYTLSHIEGKHGPLESWDLHVGARLNVLGRMTTLMQVSNTKKRFSNMFFFFVFCLVTSTRCVICILSLTCMFTNQFYLFCFLSFLFKKQ